MKRYIAMALLLVSCGGEQAKRPSYERDADGFPVPVVPGSCVTEAARAENFTVHLWDIFLDGKFGGATDSLRIRGVTRKGLEEKFALWAMLLGEIRPEVMEASVDNWFEGVSRIREADSLDALFPVMTALAEKYLFEPASPVRNEEVYRIVAGKISSSRFLEPVLREKYSRQAALCSLNRIGGKANDFEFETPDGTVRNLYGFGSNFILLLFSNPGCEACAKEHEIIRENPIVSNLLSRGELTILNIYPDEDEKAWRRALKDYPSEWISGIDRRRAIREGSLYHLWGIPSAYLLDSSKTVLLKDGQAADALAALEILSH